MPLFGTPKKQDSEKKLTVGDIERARPQGAKVTYGQWKRAMNECTVDKTKRECKSAMKEIGIDIIDFDD